MTTTPIQYYQCKLSMVRMPGRHTIGWIEKRGAKVGAKVEMLPSKEFWEVIEVFDHGMPEDMLKEHQRNHRKSFASIEAMA